MVEVIFRREWLYLVSAEFSGIEQIFLSVRGIALTILQASHELLMQQPASILREERLAHTIPKTGGRA